LYVFNIAATVAVEIVLPATELQKVKPDVEAAADSRAAVQEDEH
jgi:hypothetical protein